MGASDSKLSFKQDIFRLSEKTRIPADDPFWTAFWELPESAEDVFSLFSPTDIRRTRDQSMPNLETLILAVSSRLSILRHHPSFPDPEIAPEKDLLNCVRVLTRLLPYIYEADTLGDWEERFFWGKRRKRTRRAALAARRATSEVLFDGTHDEIATTPQSPITPTSPKPDEGFEDAKPLAEELIDTLIDLLFFTNFTVPPGEKGQKVSYAIWQTGVGCNIPIASTKEMECNRTEILRLLLTLTSKSLYIPAINGVKAITYIVTNSDKQIVLTVLCSLLNTTIKYNPASWRVPYDHVVFKDQRQVLVTYSLQLLLVLLLYTVPEPIPANRRNNFRYFLGRLHRPQDFQFLMDGISRMLNQPVLANSSYLPGSQRSLRCAPEMIMLFWEVLQCNKRFRSFIVDTDRVHDLVILLFFYTLEYRNDVAKHGVVRMCIFVLQTLSAEPNFGKGLNKQFVGQETLPPLLRLPKFHGSYADFLLISIFNLITGSKGKLDVVYPAMLAIVNNVAGHLENLSSTASIKLMELFISMSSPGFLLANESNHLLLQSLLESFNAIIEHKYKENPYFIYAIYRARAKFRALRAFTLESGQAEIERQKSMARKDTGEEIEPPVSPDLARVSSLPRRSSALSNVPEDNTAFAIGDDSDASEAEDGFVHAKASSTEELVVSRTPSVSSVDDAVPLQLRGMSEKARGKMPVGASSFSRQSSTTSLAYSLTAASTGGFTPSSAWIEGWLAELPLHTILTIVDELHPLLANRPAPGPDTPPPVDIVQSAPIDRLIIDPSPLRVQLFEWSPLALGWYESLLWGFIFQAETEVQKGARTGVWNGTAVRLFRVMEREREGPSLVAPQGAVDAVGRGLVTRVRRIGGGTA